MSNAPPNRRSAWWYLLPILFMIIGGVIAYFALRRDDPTKAKNSIILGSVLTAVWMIGQFVLLLW